MKLNFREMRNRAGYTLEDAADKLGISPSQVSRVESGTSDTTLRRTQEFAQLYECSAADLIADSDDLYRFDYDLMKDVLLGVEEIIVSYELKLSSERKADLTQSLLKMEAERLKDSTDRQVDLSRYKSLITALV